MIKKFAALLVSVLTFFSIYGSAVLAEENATPSDITGAVTEPTETPPQPEPTVTAQITPTPEMNESPTDESEPAPTATPEPKPLNMTASADVDDNITYGHRITASVHVEGGTAPYTIQAVLSLKGAIKYNETVSTASECSFTIKQYEIGVHVLKITATDSAGKTSEYSRKICIIYPDKEKEEDWIKSMAGISLSGEWGKDIVSVALTQVGYQESQRDFIVDKNGKLQGYTRYSDWYGYPYGDWCATFVSFCLNYANIPEDAVPRSSNVSNWVEKFYKMGVFHYEKDYVPQKGDIAFVRTTNEKKPTHVGIVSSVSGDSITTIEGNVGSDVPCVDYRTYEKGSTKIIGFASMAELRESAAETEGNVSK